MGKAANLIAVSRIVGGVKVQDCFVEMLEILCVGSASADRLLPFTTRITGPLKRTLQNTGRGFQQGKMHTEENCAFQSVPHLWPGYPEFLRPQRDMMPPAPAGRRPKVKRISSDPFSELRLWWGRRDPLRQYPAYNWDQRHPEQANKPRRASSIPPRLGQTSRQRAIAPAVHEKPRRWLHQFREPTCHRCLTSIWTWKLFSVYRHCSNHRSEWRVQSRPCGGGCSRSSRVCPWFAPWLVSCGGRFRVSYPFPTPSAIP